MKQMEPITDRETMIYFSQEIKQLREAIERFGVSLLNLENNKFGNHEIRLATLESDKSERKGAVKFLIFIGTFLGILLTILTIKSFLK
jgi:hypothetical protein